MRLSKPYVEERMRQMTKKCACIDISLLTKRILGPAVLVLVYIIS